MPHRRLVHASIASLLGLGCKSGGTEALTIDTSIPAAPVSAAPQRSTRDAEAPPPIAVYGYFRIPTLDRTLPLMSEQLLPPGQRGLLDEGTVRAMLQMELDGRSGVVDEIDFSRPLGCLVVSPKQYDVPLVCALGYRGGLTRLAERMGSEGFLSGGEGYVAYRIGSRAVYFVTMGEHVAFAFSPELLAATGEVLRRDVIEAPVGAQDFVLTTYPAVVWDDAHDEVVGFIEQVVAGAKPQDQAAQRKQFLSYGELEQLDLWVDLDGEAERTRLGYRGRAVLGSATDKAYAAQLGKRLDLPLVSSLPANTAVLLGMTMDTESMKLDPMWGATTQARLELGSDDARSAVADFTRRNMETWAKLWGGTMVMTAFQEPGTKGGVVMISRLKSSDDALPVIRSLFDGLNESLAAQDIQMRVDVRKGAVKVGKLRGDLVQITATNDQLRDSFKALWGTSGFEMAIVQRDDVFYAAMAPSESVRYAKRMLAPAGRKGTLGDTPGAGPMLAAHEGDTILTTVNVASMLAWLQTAGVIEPVDFEPSARADAAVLSMRSVNEHEREVVLDLSSDVIQTIYRLQGPG